VSSGDPVTVAFKLYASLSDYLPPGAVAHAVEVELQADTTVNQLIDRYKVPREMTHLVLLNGVFIVPEERDSTVLSQGDSLAIWPPVAGGCAGS